MKRNHIIIGYQYCAFSIYGPAINIFFGWEQRREESWEKIWEVKSIEQWMSFFLSIVVGDTIFQ